MKALVLSGGSGTRLRPITHTSAKQLVPVANKPILFYVLESIAATGITEVGIVVGHTAQEIQDAVGDGSSFGLDVTYIHQAQPLGLAHAVRISRDYLGDDDFVMYLGDNFIIDGIEDLVDRFRDERPDAQILLTRVPDPRAFGVAVLDEHGRVIGLEEKPEHPRSDLALAGVYFFTPLVHEAVQAVKPSWRGELEITDSIQYLIDTGADVRSEIISGYWKDTGNVTDILEVNRIILESTESSVRGEVDDASQIIGRVVVEEGAKVKGSRIVGPVRIGAGTEIHDSYIGPFTSVAENCRVLDSELEFSIMMRDSSVIGIRRIEASLIGRHVHGTAVPRVPNAHRLVLGDHSTFQISS
ncbi:MULTISPECIES: glucose-1-phosphate thymidylyltransferase [unclassified Streptomyces]|uniref:glucose-1-phosphate thymidylyltransferase n=1 Tax=unclassified Streptomyces TaxID=2593676 RepID=UPI000B510754|nr:MULTISPECIES: glucose-1-phosphate thymidylyltransferase [unclassified Streptomyces]MYX03004.1 glucose-1-phosphate thymidylyltransferase [Streptomyces sp. SID8378]PVD00128.1 glucose-1-phosphate thymidylyltransferase [Streptomyces sp. CS147]SNB89330.1 glucose-1-phosphate thymidylyltransferase [Streptomyces sp. PgraA7]